MLKLSKHVQIVRLAGCVKSEVKELTSREKQELRLLFLTLVQN